MFCILIWFLLWVRFWVFSYRHKIELNRKKIRMHFWLLSIQMKHTDFEFSFLYSLFQLSICFFVIGWHLLTIIHIFSLVSFLKYIEFNSRINETNLKWFKILWYMKETIQIIVLLSREVWFMSLNWIVNRVLKKKRSEIYLILIHKVNKW